jgi:hypothetical protein
MQARTRNPACRTPRSIPPAPEKRDNASDSLASGSGLGDSASELPGQVAVGRSRITKTSGRTYDADGLQWPMRLSATRLPGSRRFAQGFTMCVPNICSADCSLVPFDGARPNTKGVRFEAMRGCTRAVFRSARVRRRLRSCPSRLPSSQMLNLGRRFASDWPAIVPIRPSVTNRESDLVEGVCHGYMKLADCAESMTS